MEVSFLGAAKEVGRSAILLQGKRNVLLDCGIKISGKNEEYPLLEERQIKRLDYVVLSHAHLDHSGYAPALYARGYKGKTWMTKPTRDLVQLLLSDYLNIERATHAYANQDLAKMLKNVQILEYEQKKDAVTLYDSGHILGSAMTLVEDSGHRILYTADLNTRETRLLEGAKRGIQADTLIIESTYGSKQDQHLSSKEIYASLAKEVNETLSHNGKVIIPTFAIGRGQEILLTLENFLRSKAIPPAPIYLDGMVKKALRIYRHNAIHLKREVQRRILTSDDDPFKSNYYQYPERKDKSDVLEQEKAVIVTTSGMLNGGPVLFYLKHLAGDPNNKVILVGYQAAGTRGRELLDGAKELDIDDEKIEVKLKVAQAKFSAHSDHKELIEFTKTIRGLKRVFVQHGEAAKCEEFTDELGRKLNNVEVIAPNLGETIEI
ncbi:MAG: MBL fold metallo-hydrolase [Candidatus Micrarchaeota archaeon]